MSNEDVNECENCGCVTQYDEVHGDVCPKCIPCDTCNEPLNKMELASGKPNCFDCFSEHWPE